MSKKTTEQHIETDYVRESIKKDIAEALRMTGLLAATDLKGNDIRALAGLSDEAIRRLSLDGKPLADLMT